MLFIAFLLIGELCRTSGFIDIPTVPQYDIPKMWGGSVTFSLPFYNDDREADPKDFTMTLRYGLGGRTELALSMYTPNTYALSVSYLLKKEQGDVPAIFFGIDDISYNTQISTIGMEATTGFLEEKNYHLYSGGRPAEFFSTYIAMQKSFTKYLNLVIGLGRGRFVGYGERSHIFNTDLFVLGDDYSAGNHSWWAFGVFLGGSIKFPFGLEIIAEIDGRDGNAGVKYHHKKFTSTFAITKAEHFGDKRPFSPRLTFGLETNNRFMLEGPEVGLIECIIKDIVSKELLSNSIVAVKELNKRYVADGGTCSMNLQVGNYTMTIIRPDYENYTAKITVRPNVRSRLVFNLKKTQEALKREAALKEKEKNIRNYFEQGKIYYAEGNLNRAKFAFEMVIVLVPDHQGAQGYLANIERRRAELIGVYSAEAKSRMQAKDFINAIEYWQKVLDLDANNTEAKTAITDLQKRIAAEKKPPKKTKSTVVKKTTKAEIDALYRKGVFHFTAELYDEALKLFKQVLALDPNHRGAKDYKKRTEVRIKILQGGG